MAPYGPKVLGGGPQAGRRRQSQAHAGDYVIFKGPLKDNKGNVVIAAGVNRGQTDPELEKMNYLVEGVIGATS